jgi:crotonobetainyl-CoA:carnitine CoA-transferase CaiB-like acyl-CoA transferase
LKEPEQRMAVVELCADADIVLSNFKPGDDVRYGLDFDSLKKKNPRLVYGHLFGFRSNPDRVAYDTVLQAETGFMSMNGEFNGPPVKMPVALIDVLGAHQLKEGLLVALLKRAETGRGFKVEVTLEESALASLINQAGNYLMCNAIPERAGTLHPNIAPYGEMFKTADNKLLVLAVGNNKQFSALCSILGRPELARDDRFVDNPARVANRMELFRCLEPLFFARSASFWMDCFVTAHVPAGVVNNLGDVFTNNPVAQSMILEEEMDGVITRRMRSVVFRLVD